MPGIHGYTVYRLKPVAWPEVPLLLRRFVAFRMLSCGLEKGGWTWMCGSFMCALQLFAYCNVERKPLNKFHIYYTYSRRGNQCQSYLYNVLFCCSFHHCETSVIYLYIYIYDSCIAASLLLTIIMMHVTEQMA